jgi:hypothetical protein
LYPIFSRCFSQYKNPVRLKNIICLIFEISGWSTFEKKNKKNHLLSMKFSAFETRFDLVFKRFFLPLSHSLKTTCLVSCFQIYFFKLKLYSIDQKPLTWLFHHFSKITKFPLQYFAPKKKGNFKKYYRLNIKETDAQRFYIIILNLVFDFLKKNRFYVDTLLFAPSTQITRFGQVTSEEKFLGIKKS